MIIKRIAGIGSRETPDDILDIMFALAQVFCALGFELSSGDAKGPDEVFYHGYLTSPSYDPSKLRIYLPWDGIKRHDGTLRYANPALGFYDSHSFVDTWEFAKYQAEVARGGFHGLGVGGISMHSRNVFQIKDHTLEHKVARVFCYAPPAPRKENWWVGGTNTAIQIARMNDVPVINLYYPEQVALALTFLKEHGIENLDGIKSKRLAAAAVDRARETRT